MRVANAGVNSVVALGTGGNNFFTKWRGSYGSYPGQFKEPNDVSLDSSRLVYVVDTWNHRIQVFYWKTDVRETGGAVPIICKS